MRKLFVILLSLCLMFGLAACAGGDSEETAETDNALETTAAEQAEAPDSDDSNSGSESLVVYFSATGTTRGVAEKIADIEGADIYEIEAAQEYTDADLDWTDSDSRTTHEQNDPDARPEIGSEDISLDGISTIYIGYPIWHGQAPRIMSTFVEKYSFDGITVIPFCTSGSSDIGSSGQNLAETAGSGNWLEGERFDGGVTEDELRSWIEGLK